MNYLFPLDNTMKHTCYHFLRHIVFSAAAKSKGIYHAGLHSGGDELQNVSCYKTYFAEDASISFQAFSYILSLKNMLKCYSIEVLHCLRFSGTELYDIFYRKKR